MELSGFMIGIARVIALLLLVISILTKSFGPSKKPRPDDLQAL